MDLGLVSSSVVEEIAALMAAASFLEVSALRMLRMNLAAWDANHIMLILNCVLNGVESEGCR